MAPRINKNAAAAADEAAAPKKRAPKRARVEEEGDEAAAPVAAPASIAEEIAAAVPPPFRKRVIDAANAALKAADEAEKKEKRAKKPASESKLLHNSTLKHLINVGIRARLALSSVEGKKDKEAGTNPHAVRAITFFTRRFVAALLADSCTWMRAGNRSQMKPKDLVQAMRVLRIAAPVDGVLGRINVTEHAATIAIQTAISAAIKLENEGVDGDEKCEKTAQAGAEAVELLRKIVASFACTLVDGAIPRTLHAGRSTLFVEDVASERLVQTDTLCHILPYDFTTAYAEKARKSGAKKAAKKAAKAAAKAAANGDAMDDGEERAVQSE